MTYLYLDILEMSEREEIGSSTIPGIACGRIQRLTLKAWCVASPREWIFPGGRDVDICLTNQFRSLRRRRETPTGVRQLNYQRQSRVAEVLQNKAAPSATAARGLASVAWSAGHHCREPLKLMTSSPPPAGPASTFILSGSETPQG